MERTIREQVNGTTPPVDSFSMIDPATGKRVSVRTMSDQELTRHVQAASQESVMHQNTVLQAIERLVTIKIFCEVMQYELERRRNVLAIANVIP